MAAEQLYFFRKTRFCLPGSSRMSNSCSRSQLTASSYVRGLGCLAMIHLSPVGSPEPSWCCPKGRRTDTVAHQGDFGQRYPGVQGDTYLNPTGDAQDG